MASVPEPTLPTRTEPVGDNLLAVLLERPAFAAAVLERETVTLADVPELLTSALRAGTLAEPAPGSDLDLGLVERAAGFDWLTGSELARAATFGLLPAEDWRNAVLSLPSAGAPPPPGLVWAEGAEVGDTTIIVPNMLVSAPQLMLYRQRERLGVSVLSAVAVDIVVASVPEDVPQDCEFAVPERIEDEAAGIARLRCVGECQSGSCEPDRILAGNHRYATACFCSP